MSIIPVRVPAALMPVLASERRFNVAPDHPLYNKPCPVCDVLLGDAAAVLVFAGIEPGDRKQGGFTTGAAVTVHAFCAGVPAEEPEAAPRTVAIYLTDVDALRVFITALEDYAARSRDAAEHEGGNESRERWADLADQMRAQAEVTQ